MILKRIYIPSMWNSNAVLNSARACILIVEPAEFQCEVLIAVSVMEHGYHV